MDNVVLDLNTHIEFIKAVLKIQGISDNFSPGVHSGPNFKLWWMGTSGGKGGALSIQNDHQFGVMLDALKKKDKNKTQVSVEIDLDDLEGFRITVLPEFKSLLTAITTTIAMDGSINDAIQGIEEDIWQVAVDNPHLEKWFMATPELMQKKQKQKERKDKKKASKAALKTMTSTTLPTSSHVEDPADDLSIHSSDDNDNKRSTKKENKCPAKKMKTLTNITAYIEINCPLHTLKDKLEPSSTSHIEFLQSLASCSVEGSYAPTITLINQEQLFWKQQVPANDKKKPLTNEVGYKAMIAKLKELMKKGKDTMITLSLPPLSKVATMDKGTATWTELPNSTHFAHLQRLQITTKAATTPDSVDVAAPPTPVPQLAPFQPYGGYPHSHYFPPPYPYPMLPLYHSHPATNAYPNPYPDAPPLTLAPFLNAPLNPAYTPNSNHAYAQGVKPQTPGILRDAAPASAPTSPLKVTLPHLVSLEEFCICYTVDDEDRARLMKLKGRAGFTKLAWEDFLGKHKTFISDVKTGKWDAINGERFD
ncbi:hypothetical protein K443DRAFT_9972 [Laccaria amethystina LaAM-08-1]|uniref:Uncharacterized protein n=1 Tax=Laccaria amethystina LaAM-08-1 TaxID=1095629 RepID=A0A0C9XI60_9AGAR|nr:hypothetical protein K443DRAFT_9972 [Laccaria amethystina LaAM-08-1]